MGRPIKISDNILRDILVTLISSIATLAAAYFVFKGNSDNHRLETYYEQLQALQETVFAQQRKILSLEVQLAAKYDGDIVLIDYLNAMPQVAWIKKAETGISGEAIFTMWHINNAYENFFGLSNEYYTGKTDFMVWPDTATAQSFYNNDLLVLDRMTHTCVIEHFPAKVFGASNTISGLVCKWPVRLHGNWAIAGQIFFEDKLLNQPTTKKVKK